MSSPTPISPEEKEILTEYFERCVISASGGKKLSAEEKKHATGKAIMKMIEPVMGKADASFCEGGVVTKLSDKKTKKMHVNVFSGAFFPELAKYAAANVPAMKKKGATPEELKTLYMTNVRMVITEDRDEPAHAPAVVDRLTDSSKYTGSHKQRFDEDGKGKGISGRNDEASKSGYVGNYKGEGTYSQK